VIAAILLLLAPFLEAFWARDLGALHRELLETRSGEQRELFDDLLRLATCETLAILRNARSPMSRGCSMQ